MTSEEIKKKLFFNKNITTILLIFLIDLVLFNLSTFLSVLIRFDFVLHLDFLYFDRFPGIFENFLFLTFLFLFGVPLTLPEFVSLEEAKKVFIAVTLTKILSFPVFYLSKGYIHFSRGAYLISYGLSIAFLLSYRIIIRLLFESINRKEKSSRNKKRIIIVGAGSAAEKILREIEAHPELGYEVVGLLDDDIRKKSFTLRGKRIIGTIQDINNIALENKVDEVLIAIPSKAGEIARKVLPLLEDKKINVKTLPGIWEIIDGKVAINQIRNLTLEDLLRREKIETNIEEISTYLKNKTILITGAGGSIGSEISRQIAGFSPKKLILLGRGENRIFYIERELKEKYKFDNVVSIIADIKDREKIFRISCEYKPEIVFHAAAHKHVPLMESNFDEAILNNIFGTKNLLDAALESKVERFINISTDKAVNPINFMGATKRIAEILTQSYSNKNRTIFTNVRFGNVLGSTGSVIELFRKQLEETRTLRITDPQMKRFFMLTEEAVELVLQAGAMGKGGETFVLKMGDAISILELAKDFIKLSGFKIDEDVKIVIMGNRGNEKIKEELFSPDEEVLETDNPFVLKISGNKVFNDETLNRYLEELKTGALNLDRDKLIRVFKKIDSSINIA